MKKVAKDKMYAFDLDWYAENLSDSDVLFLEEVCLINPILVAIDYENPFGG